MRCPSRRRRQWSICIGTGHHLLPGRRRKIQPLEPPVVGDAEADDRRRPTGRHGRNQGRNDWICGCRTAAPDLDRRHIHRRPPPPVADAVPAGPAPLPSSSLGTKVPGEAGRAAGGEHACAAAGARLDWDPLRKAVRRHSCARSPTRSVRDRRRPGQGGADLALARRRLATMPRSRCRSRYGRSIASSGYSARRQGLPAGGGCAEHLSPQRG